MATKTTRGRLSSYPSTALTFIFCEKNSSTTAATYSATTGVRGTFSLAVTEALVGWYVVLAYEGSTLRGEGHVYYPSDIAGNYDINDPDILLSEVTKIPRRPTAIAAGAEYTKTNTSESPNEVITEVLS